MNVIVGRNAGEDDRKTHLLVNATNKNNKMSKLPALSGMANVSVYLARVFGGKGES